MQGMTIRFGAISAALGILSLASCGMMEGALDQTETVRLVAPGAPTGAEIPGSGISAAWTAHWYDSDGRKMSEGGIVGSREIFLERGFATPVILVPEGGTGPLPATALPRAGALYPIHADARGDETVLQADYPRGIAALCAEYAILRSRGGFDDGQLIISRFNWLKFDERLAGIEDPGLLDTGRFVASLLEGKMSAYDIKPLKKRACRIELSSGTIRPGCEFLPGWLGGNGFIWPETGEISLELPESMFYFLSPEGFLTVDSRKAGEPVSLFSAWSLQD